MITLAMALCLQAETVTLKYGTSALPKDKVYAETRMGIKIEGADALANFVRSMHPLLSLEKLVLRAEGTHASPGAKKHRFEYDEARIEARYDDEDLELDFQRGLPPEGLEKDKAKQMMWYLAAAGRSFSLSEKGEYRGDDPNQDQTGEAMDLISLAAIRLPDGPVKAGDAWEKSWKGERTKKGENKYFNFTQKSKVEKIEAKDGKTLVTISAELTGKGEGPKNPAAEEERATAEGKSTLVLEAETGRIVSSEGSGKVVMYFRNAGDGGQKQELTLTFSCGGKLTPR
ncbi:MAG TPA: hypothetical protein VF950_11640 [Planctomycetota bacterium]